MLGFIEFVPNGSTFNHPETVSLQATISFANECLLYEIARLVLCSDSTPALHWVFFLLFLSFGVSSC